MAAIVVANQVISQNIGIGTTNPTARLHVNGNMKLEGLSMLEFGAGISGKEANAGKIGYNAFGTGALAIVGAGSDATNRAVYVFAEAGTTFTGPVNLLGTLKVNGNPGTAGQVLTSNGGSDPQWQNAAYSNNTRFAMEFYAEGYDTPLGLTTFYNLNPTNITINANNISINKTGLYHFDGFFSIWANYSAPYTQPFAPIVTVRLVSVNSYYVAHGMELTKTDQSTLGSLYPAFKHQQKFSYDLYLVAGNTLSLIRGFAGQTANCTFINDGNLSGYLISE